jgi:hypothetical protein
VAQDIERTNVNADQKKRIAHEISNWKNACNCRAVQLAGDRMAALLQELIDAPETEPVARVTGYYAGYLSIETIDGRVLPAGTAVYTAPPAPSAPDKTSCLSTGGMTVWGDSVSIEKCNNFVHLASQAAGFKDELINTRAELRQQRGKLLVALEKCRDMVGHPDNIAFIDAAIAEVKVPK